MLRLSTLFSRGFELYSNNRSNSFVRNGSLHLHPTLTADSVGDELVEEGGELDMWGATPASQCTSNAFWGCYRTSGLGGNMINPIQSAKLFSHDAFSFTYGRVEVRAKLPRGDWLWPAIWLLPKREEYGTPRCGCPPAQHPTRRQRSGREAKEATRAHSPLGCSCRAQASGQRRARSTSWRAAATRTSPAAATQWHRPCTGARRGRTTTGRRLTASTRSPRAAATSRTSGTPLASTGCAAPCRRPPLAALAAACALQPAAAHARSPPEPLRCRVLSWPTCWQDENELYTYVDDDSNVIMREVFNESFWDKANRVHGDAENSRMTDNPWQDAKSASAPFDKEFYLIFNLAVGG